MRSGQNELRAEELVTWKVAGELMTLSISHTQKKGDDTQKERVREREGGGEGSSKPLLVVFGSHLLIYTAQHSYEDSTIIAALEKEIHVVFLFFWL